MSYFIRCMDRINRPYELVSIAQISKVYSVNKHFSPNKTPISTCVNPDVILTTKNLLIFESMEILCYIGYVGYD